MGNSGRPIGDWREVSKNLKWVEQPAKMSGRTTNMIEIIKPKWARQETTFELFFEDRRCPGAGFTFEANRFGEVSQDLSKEARANYVDISSNLHDYKAPVLQSNTRRWVEPAVGRCYCGRAVILYGFTNTCECGREYNWAGQELAPRQQWGEETGENPADIGRIA